MNTSPRVRSDLQAKPVEEAGIHYIDVSDPRNGASLRLYDFEWLIAERMDGQATLNEVAAWASARFNFAPSVDDLTAYAATLVDLGFVDPDGAGKEDGRSVKAIELPVDDEPEVEISKPNLDEPTIQEPVYVAPPLPAHAPPIAPPVAQPPTPPPAPRRAEPRPDLPRESTA